MDKRVIVIMPRGTANVKGRRTLDKSLKSPERPDDGHEHEAHREEEQH
jgi:hypothetical protein